jgi:tricorn protease
MYSTGGWIYFVSDRDGNGLTNIWRVSEKGGDAQKITKYTTGDVRWPSMSTDGKTIVFEHDFGISKLDVASGAVTAVHIELDAETQANTTELRDFASQADDYDLAPSGQRIAITVHGELFSVPVAADGGDLVQITDSPWRDVNPTHSPDGKSVAYITDQSGREEIWAASVTGTNAHKVTDIDALKNAFAWSPDSRSIAFSSTDGKLRVVGAEGGKPTDLLTSHYGNMSGVTWSPDGKWIAYVKPDFTRVGDVYIIASTGGEEHKVTNEAYAESNPRFSGDGKKLFFQRNESGGGRGAAGAGNPGSQVWAITLDREDRDPAETGAEPAAAGSKDTRIDWPGIRRRTRQITRLPYGVTSYTISEDGRTIAATTSEPTGARNIPTIYTVSTDGKRTTRVATMQRLMPAADAAAGRATCNSHATDARCTTASRRACTRSRLAAAVRPVVDARAPRRPRPAARDGRSRSTRASKSISTPNGRKCSATRGGP